MTGFPYDPAIRQNTGIRMARFPEYDGVIE